MLLRFPLVQKSPVRTKSKPQATEGRGERERGLTDHKLSETPDTDRGKQKDRIMVNWKEPALTLCHVARNIR